MSKSFCVIGISDAGNIKIPEEASKIIEQGSCFSGGKRHHKLVADFLPPNYKWIDITVPLDKVFQQYEKEEHVIVFASGDPLFYGFANTILKYVPDVELQLFPYFNSLQMLAHKLLIPYQDMHVVSLTGRPWPQFDRALIEGKELIGVLTDRKHTPKEIAKRMLDYGYDNYQMAVGALLGNETEEEACILSLDEVTKRDFAFPNNLILTRQYKRKKPFGIPDEDLCHLEGRAGMMTKMPYRMLTLQALDLNERGVFWDVGFCTGSVSIEAQLQFPHLHVEAFEIRKESRELMEENMRRMGTPGISFHIGDFLSEDLSGLPRPDALFLGGYGGKMAEFVKQISQVMLPNGVLVFNSVSEKSRNSFLEQLEPNGLRLIFDRKLGYDDYNPIHQLKVEKISYDD